jgi:hypothetical protein
MVRHTLLFVAKQWKIQIVKPTTRTSIFLPALLEKLGMHIASSRVNPTGMYAS